MPNVPNEIFSAHQTKLDSTLVECRGIALESLLFVFSGSLDILRSIIPIYIVLSLSQFMPPMLTVIVDEKEKKIKESMRMVGLRDSVFWEV